MRISAMLMSAFIVTVTPAKRNCFQLSEELLRYANLPSVSDSVLARSRIIVDEISGKCTRDGVTLRIDGKRHAAGSLISIYGRICERSVSGLGVEYFLAFRMKGWHSGDENYALAIERIFARRPDILLEKIHPLDDSLKIPVLNEIVWGFINNRRYGAIDPFDAEIIRPLRPRENPPREVLNRHTFRGLFFDLNPKIRALDKTYGKEIDFMLKQTRNYFETWGDLK